MKKTREYKIAITFNPSLRVSQEMIAAIWRYAQSHELPWKLFMLEYVSQLTHEQRMEYFNSMDAIISPHPQLSDEIIATGKPAVFVNINEEIVGYPCLSFDYVSTGKMAAAHLINCGVHYLAMFAHGSPDHQMTQICMKGFGLQAQQVGMDVCCFTYGQRTIERGLWELADQIEDLKEFIEHLPKPVGILCLDRSHTLRLLQAIQTLPICVPDDVLIISAMDTEILFETISPTITSVMQQYDKMGQEGARIMHDILEGRPLKYERVIPPLGIVERESTSMQVVNDDLLEPIVAYIWRETRRQLSVQDLLEKFPVSQSTLSRQCKKVLRRTPAQEIQRSRIETAKRLLQGTDMPLAQVAVESGYGVQSLMGRYVKAATGKTPRQYRARFRRG